MAQEHKKDESTARLFTLLTVFLAVSLFHFLSWRHLEGAEQKEFDQRLRREAEQQRLLLQTRVTQENNALFDLAQYLSNQPDLVSFFAEGKREELLNHVQDGWNAARETSALRQLHFHYPPATSFLRVHKPQRFGDDLTSVRPGIVATNKTRKPVLGFEQGRVFSGLRAIVPVFREGTHIGSLECGSGLNRLLDEFAKNTNTVASLFLLSSMADQKLWEENRSLVKLSSVRSKKYELDAATNAELVKELVAVANIDKYEELSPTELHVVGGTPNSLRFLELVDFAGDHAGVFVWAKDVSQDLELLASTRAETRQLLLGSLALSLLLSFLLVQFLSGRLQRVIDQRTREYREERDRADKATRAKSEFLAHMSHEIRTPMNAVLGFVDLLDDDLNEIIKDEEQRAQMNEMLEIVRTSGEHLLGLLNDILDFSKIEAKGLELELENYSLVRILENSRHILEGPAHSKHLQFEYTFSSPLPTEIRTDVRKLRQILVNLIGNAIKFTESGGVQVDTRFIGDKDQGSYIEIRIQDSGIGMSSEEVAQLFDPFSRIDSYSTRDFEGSGLGLSISKKLAEALGGEIRVESRSGEGSCFTVCLPVEEIAENQLKDAKELLAIVRQGKYADLPQVDAGVRVLVIEDNRVNQKLVVSILTRAGATVEVADNGETGIEAALNAWEENQAFDVVLTDLQMPILDGREVIRQLRNRGYPGRIVAITAHALSSERAECESLGCDGYLTKPINRKLLLEQLLVKK